MAFVKKIGLITSALSIVLGFSVNAADESIKWPVHADISGKVGNKRSLGQASIFTPFFQNEKKVLFADLRFMGDSKHSREGNFGLGYRYLSDDDFIAGIYGFYDLRRSAHKNLFSQLTFGAEFLTENWDFRANTYISVSSKKAVRRVRFDDGRLVLRGNQLVRLDAQVMTFYERPLNGFDVEISRNVPFLEDLKLSAAYYQFWGQKVKNIYGVRGRADYNIFKNVTLQGEISYDRTRKLNYFGGFNVRIPLGKTPQKPRSRLRSKMNQRVERDIDIVTAEMKYPVWTEVRQDLGKAALDPKSVEEAVKNGAQHVILSKDRELSEGDAAALSVSGVKVLSADVKPGGEVVEKPIEIRVPETPSSRERSLSLPSCVSVCSYVPRTLESGQRAVDEAAQVFNPPPAAPAAPVAPAAPPAPAAVPRYRPPAGSAQALLLEAIRGGFQLRRVADNAGVAEQNDRADHRSLAEQAVAQLARLRPTGRRRSNSMGRLAPASPHRHVEGRLQDFERMQEERRQRRVREAEEAEEAANPWRRQVTGRRLFLEMSDDEEEPPMFADGDWS